MKVFLKMLVSVVTVCILSACGQSTETGADTPDIRAWLYKLGWESGAFIESVTVTIPAQNEAVFREYNRLQLQNGYDLTPYCGRQVTRYSCEIVNHPRAEGRAVTANILIYEGNIIGGDIMVTALDGFMHGLCAYPGE